MTSTFKLSASALETLFAALAGAVYLGERLQSPQMAGAALIMASILLVQLLPLRRGAPA